MSRLQDAINRLELVARKMEMSIEDALLVLEGRHPTHVVTQKYKEVPVATSAVASSPAEAVNPTTSGPAVASASTTETAVVSTEPSSAK